MKRVSLGGVAVLLVVTMIWGTTFVTVKQTLDAVPVSWLVMVRFGLAALCVAPWVWRLKRSVLRAGLELGAILCVCYGSQSLGLTITSPGRSAFITSLFVVLVPLWLWVRGARHSPWVWAAASAALLGVGLLSSDGGAPNAGDAITLLCAMGYAAYLLRMERYSERFDTMELTAAQLCGVTLWSTLWFVMELGVGASQWPEHGEVSWGRVLYLSVVATALTTWMQTYGQQRVGATRAAFIYMLEPVWALVFAFLILGDVLGWRGWLGAALILSSLCVVELLAAARRK